MHTVRGNTGAEAAFHFLSQALSVATQNSSPAVIVSVYIHEFNLNVSEIFLSKQRWGCGAGYLSASIKVCPICLFSSKLLLSNQTYRWHNCMWFFISVPLLNECFTCRGSYTQLSSLKMILSLISRGHSIIWWTLNTIFTFICCCCFFFFLFYLKQKSVISLMQHPWVLLRLYFCTASNIKAIYVTFFQLYLAAMKLQFKGVTMTRENQPDNKRQGHIFF